jgi:hypothetical protein
MVARADGDDPLFEVDVERVLRRSFGLRLDDAS